MITQHTGNTYDSQKRTVTTGSKIPDFGYTKYRIKSQSTKLSLLVVIESQKELVNIRFSKIYVFHYKTMLLFNFASHRLGSFWLGLLQINTVTMYLF